MFQDYDDYDGYQARETVRVCPDCGRPELFCDPNEHQSADELAESLAQ